MQPEIFMSKDEALLELAKLRQRIKYDGHTTIGEYQEGVWECDFVSPYSKSSNNSDSDILVILQDWCSSESFDYDVCEETLKLGHTPSVRTNINLKRLLATHFERDLAQIYSTNLFPYVKPGSMNARIPAADLLQAAKQFTIPMIDIIQPKIVICLGKDTFNALRKACGLRVVYSIEEAVNSTFTHNQSKIFCQAHTGQLGQNNRNRGGIDRVQNDWASMRTDYLNA